MSLAVEFQVAIYGDVGRIDVLLLDQVAPDQDRRRAALVKGGRADRSSRPPD